MTTRWFILSAIGRDRPGLVSELARLVLDSRRQPRGLAHDDPRHRLRGDPALLVARRRRGGSRSRWASKRLERDHGLTILIRELAAGRRPAIPAPGTRLYRVEAAGEDRAGIVAGICGVLAEHGVNIVELDTQSRPGPGGAPHYQMTIRAEVPDAVEPRTLREALDREADRLVLDVALMPALK